MMDLHRDTIFAAAIVCLLTSIYLFARRHEGERSRIILAAIILFSVFNYAPRYWNVSHGQMPQVVVSAPMLLLGLFMTTSYIMYPIEVISPGWLNFRNIIKLYIPVTVLCGIWLITLGAGVTYASYNSFQEMIPHSGDFDVWFRYLLGLLILSPVLFIFFVPYTRKYSNTDNKWVWKYTIILSTNILAFIVVLSVKNLVVGTIYYYISVGCSLLIAYMELSIRLIGNPVSENMISEMPNESYKEVPYRGEPIVSGKSLDNPTKSNSPLFNKLDEYMKKNAAWRDPDLTLSKLSSIMNTNRTTLSLAIQNSEYGNYTTYINKLRFDDFVYLVTSQCSGNFQEAFYDAGFRSRTTALRNFRQITGMTPTEYFTKKKFKPDETNCPN